MGRIQARDSAFKLIFEYLFTRTKGEKTHGVFTNAGLDAADIAYLDKVYYGVIEHFDEITALISENAVGYSLDRIYRADLAVLCLCVFELKYMPEIPPASSINEAVNLVKTYSTEKSSKFVNGVLAAIYRSIYS